MALPDDGTRILTDAVTEGNAVSALISPAFVKSAIFLSLVNAQTCSPGTNVIKFRISGSLTAEAVADSVVYTPTDANTLLTDTSVTATATKVVSAGVWSVESEAFGAGSSNRARYSAELGAALARKFDADCITLIDSITNVATATSTMDTDTLNTGVYNIENSNVPPGPLVAVMSPRQVNDLRKLVANSGAAIYSTQYNSPFFGPPQANRFQGNFLGVDIYQTTGLTATGGDTQGAIFNPKYFFGAAMGSGIGVNEEFTGTGVALNKPGFSTILSSWMFYNVVVWRNAAACELRSDT